MQIEQKLILLQAIEWLQKICNESSFESILEITQSCENSLFDYEKVEPLINSYNEEFKINLFTAYYLLFLISDKYHDDIWGSDIGLKINEYVLKSNECQKYFDSLPISNDIKRKNNDEIESILLGVKGSIVGSLYNLSKIKNYNLVEELTYVSVFKEKPGGNIYKTPAKWLKFLQEIYDEEFEKEKDIKQHNEELEKWELHSVSVKGESHKKCDDNSNVIKIDDKTWVAYSADGLGSRSMSHIGSKIAGECFVECIEEMHITLHNLCDVSYSEKMIDYIQNNLTKEFSLLWQEKINEYIVTNELEKTIDDFASTLLVSFGCDKFIMCGIIGDGNLIIEKNPVTASNNYGYTTMTDCFSDVVQKSVINITHLVDKPYIMQYRFFKCEEISSIILASDGANALCYKNIGGAIFPNMDDLLNSTKIFDELRELNFEDCSSKLLEYSLKFSKGNKFGGGRGDDCSIVYIKSRR